jgi:hypothetical protein
MKSKTPFKVLWSLKIPKFPITEQDIDSYENEFRNEPDIELPEELKTTDWLYKALDRNKKA